MSDNPASAYLRHLGLARSPFPPTPDAESYFHTRLLESELAEAAHCLLARKGFVLLTGEVGMGKSTFLRRLLDAVVREGAIASLVFNTFLQGPDLLAAICRDFGIEPSTNAAGNLDAFNRFLLRCWNNGTTCVLVIDDAQNLSIASLELLRLLSNLESGQEKLLQIVLAGQSELDDVLASHEIRQLTSRIVKHIRMLPLSADESIRYVDFRLAQAGAAGRIRIDAGAHACLHRRSHGNPRRIHLIMDRCLYGVVARGDMHIDTHLVRAAATEAGFLSARRSWRYLPLAAAALLATGLATAAGVALWQRDAPTQASQQPAAAVISSNHSSVVNATTEGARGLWGDCLQRLSTATNTAHAVQIFAIPAQFHAVVAARHDVCLQPQNANWLIAWQPRLPTEQLQSGLRSETVRQLQLLLLQHGAFDPAANTPVDGLFGQHTRTALGRFQQAHGLPISGNADPLTLLLLDTLPATTAANPTPTEPAHVRS